MILFMWVIIFVVAFIPGGLVGWMIGLIPAPTALHWALLAGGSVAAAFVASRMISNSADLHYHFENLVMLWPPILLSMMAGLRFSRARGRGPGKKEAAPVFVRFWPSARPARRAD
jgi:hypothetical protein